MIAKSPFLLSFFRYFVILITILMAFTAIATFWKMNHLAQSGVTTTGIVSRIDIQFDRKCGSGSFNKDCTRFKAWIEYTVEGVTYFIENPAGKIDGTTSDTNQADYHVGESVAVLYDPNHPSLATLGDTQKTRIFGYAALLLLLPAIGLLWRSYQKSRAIHSNRSH